MVKSQVLNSVIESSPKWVGMFKSLVCIMNFVAVRSMSFNLKKHYGQRLLLIKSAIGTANLNDKKL